MPLEEEPDLQRLKAAIVGEFSSHPPKVGVVGVSGTGKSSTINAMFRTDLAISHTVACTKQFRQIQVDTEVHTGKARGMKVHLDIVDAPGLGEDRSRDPEYLRMYKNSLGDCDVVLWILAARNRAIALDQHYLRELSAHSSKMVFGINQIDLVEPMDWQTETGLPSGRQEQHIAEILIDRKIRIENTLDRSVACVAYSAIKKYNLQELFTSTVEAIPIARSWIFSAIKGFRPEDFLPPDVREGLLKEVARATQD